MAKISLVAAALLAGVHASRNGLGITPQMGWVSSLSRATPGALSLTSRLQNNWNAFGCDVSETLLLDTANLLVSMGFRDAGYDYVSLDDCWQSSARDPTTHRLTANVCSRTSPSLPDSVHRLIPRLGYSLSRRHRTRGVAHPCARDEDGYLFHRGRLDLCQISRLSELRDHRRPDVCGMGN